MALAIEFVNVVVRKHAVERSFPHGLDGFAQQNLANLTEDAHLLRVGFMSTSEAMNFVAMLQDCGLHYVGVNAQSDLAVFATPDDPLPPWLSAGYIDNHPACWASDYSTGELVFSEPGFLLRLPWALYQSLRALIPNECGAHLRQVAAEWLPGALAHFECDEAVRESRWR